MIRVEDAPQFPLQADDRAMPPLIRVEDAPQFPLQADDHNMPLPTSVYYRVPTGSEILDPNVWEMNWHGTYFYTLWDAVTNGLRCGGVPGEGGDNHVVGEELVYTTPNPRLAYTYALRWVPSESNSADSTSRL